MAREDRSIAERQGFKGGYELMFGSSDSEELTRAAKEKMAQHDYAGLRGFVLNALGIEEKENPEYLIIIGCVRVFDSPDGLRNYFGLLDKLGVTYTFLRTTEYCSNLPALHTAAGERAWQAAWEGARDLGEKNLEQARKLGVKGVAYFCSDSYAIAQQVFTKFGLDMEPIFYLDILPERLEGRPLRLDPCVVGFFPGCWRERRLVNSELRLNHQVWRSMVERIEGVRVVDLPSHICCKEDPLALVEAAERLGADCIVTPCHGLGQANFKKLKRVPAKTVSDLLMEALLDEAIS